MRNNYSILTLLFLFLPFLTSAQELWSKTAGHQVMEKFVNLEGNLMLLRPDGIRCLSKTSGDELWFAPIDQPTGLTNIPGTTFMYIYGGKGKILINSLSGKVLYDTRQAGHSEVNLINGGRLLVWGGSDKGTEVLVLDNASGAQVAKFKVADEMLAADEIIKRKDGKVLVFTAAGLTVLDGKAGKLLYTLPLKQSDKLKLLESYSKPTFATFETANPAEVVVLKDGYLSNIDLANGKVKTELALLWPSLMYHETEQGQLVLGKRDKKSVALQVIDKNSGKEIKSGSADVSNAGSLLLHENGLFVLSTSTLGGSSVKLVDMENFSVKAAKTFKTGGSYYGSLFNSDKGIGLTGGYNINYYDPKTYEAISSTRFYAPAIKCQVKEGDNVYFYSSGHVGRFNQKKGEEEIFTKEKVSLKLQEGEEPQVQLVEDGVLLMASQSVAKVDFKGNLLYNEYFAPPGPSAGKVIGNALVLAASAYLATDAQTKSQAATTSTTRQYYQNDAKMYQSLGGEAGKGIRERFSKTANAMDYQVMLTKADGNDAGKFKLVKFNTKTGKVEGQVEVSSRTPDYVFDPVDSRVYVFQEGTMQAYKI